MNLKPAAPVLSGAFVLLALGVLIARTDPSPAPEPSPAAVDSRARADHAVPGAQPGGPSVANATAADRHAPAGSTSIEPGWSDRLDAWLDDALPESHGDAARLRAGFLARVAQAVSGADRAWALSLAERYFDYRRSLGELRPPKEPLDPHALRALWKQRSALRARFFDPEERSLLFAYQEDLDANLLARLELLRHPNLEPEARQRALAELEADLPEPLRAGRAESVRHLEVLSLEQSLRAQRASPQERFEQRAARFGVEVATRLMRLDEEEQDWNRRLDAYAAALPSARTEQERARLQEHWFTPEERLRLEAALSARGQH